MDQPLPFNEGAEIVLMSCALLDPQEVMPAIVERINDSYDAFGNHNCKVIYYTCCQLLERNEEIDILSVVDRICKAKQYQDQFDHWSEVVMSIYKRTPTAAVYEKYLDTVDECYMRRRLIRALAMPAIQLYDQEECFYETKRGIAEALDSAESAKKQSVTIQERMQEVSEYIKEGGVKTYIDKLDNTIKFLGPSDLMLVAGRSGEGKSHCITNMVLGNAERGLSVGIISLEMEPYEYMSRFVANRLRMDSYDVLSNKDVEHVSKEIQRIEGLPIYYNSDPEPMPVSRIEATAKKWKAQHDIGLLVIDHMHLIIGKGSKNDIYEDAANRLKVLQRKLGIPVVALAQLNKEAMKTDSSGNFYMPNKGHIISSSAIANAATKIVILHRDRATPEQKFAEQKAIKEKRPIKLMMNVEKNRGGGEVVLSTHFYPQYSYIDGSRVTDQIVEELNCT